jgi:NTE family protein
VQKRIEELQAAATRLAAKLPKEFAADPDLQALTVQACEHPVMILQLINRSEDYESQGKDYEFSRATINDHWQSGMRDVARSFASPRWKQRQWIDGGIVSLDLA